MNVYKFIMCVLLAYHYGSSQKVNIENILSEVSVCVWLASRVNVTYIHMTVVRIERGECVFGCVS
jgi:hypothetical protein